MNSPSPSAPMRKSDRAARSRNHDPRIGRSNNSMATTMMPIADTIDTMKYGTVLPTTNENASSGAIRTCSIVPRSFSRTIERAVDTIRDHQHGAHVVAVHQPGRLGIIIDRRDEIEVAGVDERGDERPAFGRAIAVVDGQPDVPDVEVERIAVQQEEERRHEQQNRQRPAIANDLPKLLATDGDRLAHD